MKFLVNPSITTMVVRWVQWMTLGCAGVATVEPIVRPHTVQIPDIGTDSASFEVESMDVETVRLKDLSGIWSRHLRQVLIEPKVLPSPPPKAEPPPPPVVLPKLVATFVEGGKASALITDEGGKLRVRTAGETIGTFQVHQIRPGCVVLQRSDKTYELQVPTSTPIPDKAGRNQRRLSP